ncbi:hypothetical protein [Buttiauxella gaviniae]|uniref:hypothetical protein n=1 Tax=Buttiauxella gaviniae TaxID=82990 RepID=UPI003BB7D6B7
MESFFSSIANCRVRWLDLPGSDFTKVRTLKITTTVLPDCGHSMSWENPSALSDALDAFGKMHE